MPPVARIPALQIVQTRSVVRQQTGAERADAGAHGPIFLVDRIGFGEQSLLHTFARSRGLNGPPFHPVHRPAQVHRGRSSRTEESAGIANSGQVRLGIGHCFHGDAHGGSDAN
jgi:hypothetical protein